MDIRGLEPFDGLVFQKLHQVLTGNIREIPECAFSWCWDVKTGTCHELRNPRNAALGTGKGQEISSPSAS